MLNAVKELVQFNYQFIAKKINLKFGLTKVPAKFLDLFHEKKVLNGIFKGLKYVGFNSVGSALFPKLLGSYELELQEKLHNFLDDNPPLVIDIGCAEGYFAVGIAKLLPESHIIAADSSADARKLCSELAVVNECKNVEVTGAIDAQKLSTYDLANSLIICDCEGYEKELFTPQLVPHLKKTNLIIETHDFIDLSISPYLVSLFENTHQIETITSIDDIQKVKYYKYTQLEGLTTIEKKEILSEHRPTVMEWLILRPLA